jgi:hypothetical protein
MLGWAVTFEQTVCRGSRPRFMTWLHFAVSAENSATAGPSPLQLGTVPVHRASQCSSAAKLAPPPRQHRCDRCRPVAVALN